MSTAVRPDEISSLIKAQISSADLSSSLQDVGTVVQVGDGIARVYGLNNVQAGGRVEFENGVRTAKYYLADKLAA